MSTAESEYGKATNATNSWQTSLNLAQADLQNMSSELEKTDKYLAEAKGSTDNTATSINQYGKEVSEASEKTLDFGDVMKANLASDLIVKGLEATVEVIKQMGVELYNTAVNAFQYADDIMTMSTNTSIAAETLQELKYAQELMDVSLETVTGAMAKNIKSMYNAQKGTEDYVDAYKKLGVEVTNATDGSLRPSEQVFWDLIDALGGMENQAERDAISMTLLGRSAQSLNSLVAIGSEGFKELATEAKATGYVLGQDTLDKLLETSDAFERMNNKIEGTKNKIGAELAPVLTEAFEEVGSSVEDLGDGVVDFAEDAIPKLVDGFEWILDNSDILIAGITGIGTATLYHTTLAPGIAAVSTAWQAYKLANDGATISQWALNTAMTANPAGLLLTAVVGLTSAIAVYSLVSDESASATQNMVNKASESASEFKKAIESHDGVASSIQAEAGHVKVLASELDKLNGKEKLSTTEKARMTAVVNELNKVLPDLNLTIDEQTGKLQGNTAEIEKNIEKSAEWYAVKAGQEELSKIYGEMYSAELEIYKIDQQIAEQNEIANSITGERTRLLEEYNEVLSSGKDTTVDYEAKLGSLSDKETEALVAVEQLTESKKDFNATQADGQAQIDVLNGFIQKNTEELERNAGATGELTEAQIVYKDSMYGVSEEVSASIQTIQTAYDDAKASAEDSLRSQVGMFDELKAKSDLSTAQMAENLSSQTEVFNQYKEDLISAAELVEKGLMDDGLLGSIEKLGVDGAGYLHELVTAAENDKESFAKVMDEWAAMETSRDMLSGTMADIETDYSGQMDSILGIVTDKVGEIDETVSGISESMKTITTETAESVKLATENSLSEINTTILTERATINKSIKLLSSGMLTSIDIELNIVDGKSLKFQSKGLAITDGIAQGITDGTGKVSAAIKTMVQKAVDSIDLSGIVAQIDEKLGDRIS